MTGTDSAFIESPQTAQEWTLSQPSRDFCMSEGFWDRFVAEYWTSGPLLIRSPFTQPLVTEEEIFHAVRTASEEHRAQGVSELMVFIDGGSRQCDVVDFLPEREDASLASYRRRLEGFLGSRQFTLLLPKLQVHNPDLWMRVRRFLSGLYDRVGLPGSMADLDIFYGRYDRTPHGIHRDEASNFTYVVSGTKRMLFWPEETFPGRTGKASRLVGTMRYEDHLLTATEIVAHEGDLLFWPASYWHIAVSDDEWPLTLNMNSYIGRHALHSLAQAVMTPELGYLLNSRCQPLISVKSASSKTSTEPSVPEEVRVLGEVMRDIGNHQSLQQSLEELWFKKLSATGFEVTPQPAAISQLSPDTILQSDSHFPVLLVPKEDGSVRIFANGNVVSARAQPSIRRMIDLINTGCRTTVDSLIFGSLGADAVNPDQTKQLNEVLVSLCNFRALTRSVAP
jgi:50S ribosomal protein L16 3-hydroxylase